MADDETSPIPASASEVDAVADLSRGLPTARMDITEDGLGPNFEIGRYIYDED
jgi:hypothetical protein